MLLADADTEAPYGVTGEADVTESNTPNRISPLLTRFVGFDSPDLAEAPSKGRFTQMEPLTWNRPFSHYAYAGNNPVSASDPSGLITEEAAREWRIQAENFRESDLLRCNLILAWVANEESIDRAILNSSSTTRLEEKRRLLNQKLQEHIRKTTPNPSGLAMSRTPPAPGVTRAARDDWREVSEGMIQGAKDAGWDVGLSLLFGFSGKLVKAGRFVSFLDDGAEGGSRLLSAGFSKALPSATTAAKLERFAAKAKIKYVFDATDDVGAWTDAATGLVHLPKTAKSLADVPVLTLADEFGHAFAFNKGVAQTAVGPGGFRGRQYWKEHFELFKRAEYSSMFTESEKAIMREASERSKFLGYGAD